MTQRVTNQDMQTCSVVQVYSRTHDVTCGWLQVQQGIKVEGDTEPRPAETLAVLTLLFSLVLSYSLSTAI